MPVIAWTGKYFDYNLQDIKPFKDVAISHDDLFCTLLIAYELESKMCAGKNAIFAKNKMVNSYAISEEKLNEND